MGVPALTMVEASIGFEMNVIIVPLIGPVPIPGVGIDVGPSKIPGTTSIKNYFLCLPKVIAGSMAPVSTPCQPPAMGIIAFMVAGPSFELMGAPTLLVEGRPASPMGVYPESNNLFNAPACPPLEMVCFKILQKVA